jgi:hypothetical protein
VDEQAASLMKWPVPILSVTRVEWVPQVKSDLFVFQTPSHLSPLHLASLQKLFESGQPVAVFGSSEGVDATLMQLGGLRANAAASGQLQLCPAKNQVPELVKNAVPAFETYCRPDSVSASAEAHVFYTVQDSPRLTLNTAAGKQVAVWNPPDLRSVDNLPLTKIWGNTGAPYALAAAALNQLLKQHATLHADAIDLQQTMNITAWRTNNGTLRILAGNLEEGLRDDADLSRHTTLDLPKSWSGASWKDAWSGRSFSAKNNLLDINLNQAESVLLESSK